MSISPTKIAFTLTAVMAMTICCTQESNAQRRGFRIGNVLQAGGGQGFRLGGNRAGMQFGGGQGAIIGGQNVGMRFGNGQGTRIGSRTFGMQFGGGQGTQFGRLANGTYYNGAVPAQVYPQRAASVRPMPSQRYSAQRYSVQPYSAQPNVIQPNVIQPNVIQPNAIQPTVVGQAYTTNLNQGVVTSSYVQPVANAPQGAAQFDIARASMEVETSEAKTPANTEIESAVPGKAGETILSTTSIDSEKGEIRLSFPAEATEPFKYKVNGSELTIKPGETVLMGAGNEWNIEFSAGGEFGERVATLKESGAFAFEKSESEGWVLVENQIAQPAASDESTFTNEASMTETPEIETPKTETPATEAPVTETPATETVPPTTADENVSPPVPANGDNSGN